jgi:hypothetical protein
MSKSSIKWRRMGVPVTQMYRYEYKYEQTNGIIVNTRDNSLDWIFTLFGAMSSRLFVPNVKKTFFLSFFLSFLRSSPSFLPFSTPYSTYCAQILSIPFKQAQLFASVFESIHDDCHGK